MGLLKICVTIFLARIVDVSLGTFVTVLTVKNKRMLATVIGFFDVIISCKRSLKYQHQKFVDSTFLCRWVCRWYVCWNNFI